MEKITILIADDHRLVRESWSILLNATPDLQVIAETGYGEEAIRFAEQLRPDIILMDVNMNPVNGFEATTRIKKILPESKVIGISIFSNIGHVRNMIKSGASGYISKNSSKDEMIRVIKEVHAGGRCFCKEIQAVMMGVFTGETEYQSLNALTRREFDIVHNLMAGMSSREIAESKGISLKTVEVHRYNILRKLKVPNTASLINIIYNKGLMYR